MRRRAAAAVAGIVAAGGLLAACSKPAPSITLLANRTVTVVQPQTYCFDANPNDCRIDPNAIGAVHAASGSAILVDVPRTVASSSWQVQAATTDSSGKFSAVDSPGASSPALSDQHSTRVVVPTLTGTASYFLIVRAGAQSGSRGAWVARVTVTPS